MQKKLISKSEFARLAGVNPSTITRIIDSGLLKKAVSGKRIDAAHPDAVSYLEQKSREQTQAVTEGMDPLYEWAVKYCTEAGVYSKTFIQKQCRVGRPRATKLLDLMTLNGLVPTGTATPEQQVTTPVVVKPRGNAAANITKKTEALRNLVNTPEPVVHDIPEDIRAFGEFTLRDLIERYGTDTAFLDWLKATKSIEDIHEKRLKNAEKAGELISRDLVSNGILGTIDGAFNRMLTDGAKTIALRAHSLAATGGTVMEIEDLVAKQLTTFIKPTKQKMKRVLKNA